MEMGGGMKILWQRGGEKEQDAWYWVTNGRDIWIMQCDYDSAGGWTNGDTCEDFRKEIIGWIKIEKPEAIDELVSYDCQKCGTGGSVPRSWGYIPVMCNCKTKKQEKS